MMLLPDKHITVAKSILGLSTYIYDSLSSPVTLDNAWERYSNINDTDDFPAYHSFEDFLLAVYFLFSIQLISQDEKGRLVRCD